jgi:acyl carrier protein
MSNLDLAQKLKQFITTNFYVADPASLTSTASFLDQGIIDSTGVLEVVSYLEETFGIAVSDSEMLPENLDSLQGLCDFVQRKLSAQPRPDLISAKEESPSLPDLVSSSG